MNRSESISKISAALLKAQRKIEGASKGADNPYFKSKYANLNSVMEACKEALNENGISVLQPISSDEHGEYVETTLLHESGEFITSRMKLILAKNDMQAFGSAVSYARRYGLQSLVFIGAEDDDGESAVSRPSASASVKNVPTLTTADEAKAKAAAPVAAASGTEEKKGFRRVGGSKPAFLNGAAAATAAPSAATSGGDDY